MLCGCRLVDGVVVVVVGEERRWVLRRGVESCSTDVNGEVGADSSGGRTAELLKGAASVEPSCNTVVPPGRGVARRRGECWSVATSGGGREAYSADDVNVRRWGMSADLPSGAAAGCSVVTERGVPSSSDGAVN